MYKIILWFLGLKSINYNKTNIIDKFICQKKIKYFDNTNSKKISNISPKITIYEDSPNNKNNNKINNKLICLYYLYNIYSFIIFLYLCIQPIYLVYSFYINNKIEYLITFFINIMTPINYLWAKNYFLTNHFDKSINNKCGNIYSSFIILLSILSIIFNIFDEKSYKNEFYWNNSFNDILFYISIIIEWLYSRILLGLISICFTLIFCNHRNQINIFIKEINDLEEYNLKFLINKISILRNNIQLSIEFYNKLISIITLCGGLSISLFIRTKYNENLSFEHERYLIYAFLFYVLCQLIFFYNILSFSNCRNNLLKFISSPDFINTYLFENSNNDIQWMLLNKIIENRWLDFTIMGISTQDGSLIKKVITFSGLFYVFYEYLF